MDWSKGEFYYASDFDSEVMANFSNKLNSYVGRRRGTDEGKTDVTEAAPTLDPGAVDPDESAAAMNDNTLYQMFDSTNESDEWLSRTVDENTLILAGEDPAAGREYEEGQNWNLFNIFANGSLTASPDVNVDKTTDVAYTHGTELASAAPDGAVTPLPDLKGLALNYKTGLSTLAMYNYLSTDFTPTGMVIYSPAKSSNGHTVKAHFKVNMVGSGMMEIIFFLNCAAFLLVMVILGLYYTIGMAVSVIKQSFKMILNTPFALMGLLGSIAQVVTIVVTMVIEIIGSIAIYELMSELLFTIVTAFEGPLRESLANVEAASHVGGLLAMMTSAPVEGLAFDARFTAFMCGITLGLFGLSYGAVKLAPAVMRVREKATELFLMKYILNAEQAAGYAENVRRERARREAERERREGEPLGEPVCQGFTAAFHEVITSA